MIIELNLEQAEEILALLSKKEVVQTTNLRNAISTIKGAIKNETHIQVKEMDKLIKRINDNGYTNVELTSAFDKARKGIQEESTKTKDKYFDGNGNEKA